MALKRPAQWSHEAIGCVSLAVLLGCAIAADFGVVAVVSLVVHGG